MGNCADCKEADDEVTLVTESEEDIEFPIYSSISDNHLECLEKDNNLFRYTTLVEYVNLLAYFTLETEEIPFDGPYRLNFSFQEKFLSEFLSEELFQSFLENTILKNRELGEQETTFKEMCLELFKSLKLKLKELYGDENKQITKRDLICLGILFCKASNINKIKLFFDIFKNKREQFVQSDELDEFLLSSFLISSFCLISAQKSLSQNNPTIPEFSIDELKILLEKTGLEDCQSLVKYFNKNFFFHKTTILWHEFKQKFMGDSGFGWIFSTKGIRQKLQEKQNESNIFINKVFTGESKE